MKALVKTGPGKEGIKVQDIKEPVPGPEEIKINIIAGGICGTDIHIMKDEYAYHPPVVMGHEYVGVVDEVGSNVSEFEPGDYVVSLTAVKTCGKCKYCNENLPMLCDERLSIGSGVNGAFAEYMTIPAYKAFKLPADVKNVEQYAITEPLACVVRGVIERATVSAGDIVLVSGPGTIGLLTAQVAKAQGGFVIVSGIPGDEERLELAKKIGADLTVSEPEKLDETIRSLSPYGVDVAFECSGATPSADACLRSLRKQGLYFQLGLFGEKIPVDMDGFLYKEITIINSFASEPSSWEYALRLLNNGQVNLEPLISAKVPLEDWEKGFEMFMDKSNFKILLIP